MDSLAREFASGHAVQFRVECGEQGVSSGLVPMLRGLDEQRERGFHVIPLKIAGANLTCTKGSKSTKVQESAGLTGLLLINRDHTH